MNYILYLVGYSLLLTVKTMFALLFGAVKHHHKKSVSRSKKLK